MAEMTVAKTVVAVLSHWKINRIFLAVNAMLEHKHHIQLGTGYSG